MIPVPVKLLDRLDLVGAIAREAASWQGLLPPSPGWDLAAGSASGLARWLRGQLLAGLAAAPEVVVSARKAPHGVRPVPVWGFAERITYRSLTEFILRDEPALDRSADAYLAFTGAPVRYADSLTPPRKGRKFFNPFGSQIGYVVHADITAFYQCVDHGILGKELLARTGEFEAIECLTSLLSEVQGRSFGLPQLLESSDRLSELYIDVVERDVLRRGWATWRFNDDFRIAVRNYGDALASIEDLAAAAREVGLTLSDLKTTTPRYATYLMKNFGLQIDDEVPEDLRRVQPEDAVGDYMEGVGETDPSWALDIVESAKAPEQAGDRRDENGINLSNVHGDDFRQLRRAMGRLARAATPDALPQVLKLFAYVPPLTPWTVRYIVAAGSNDAGQALETLDNAVDKISLSDWQRTWIIRGFDDLNGLANEASEQAASRRLEWFKDLRHSRCGPIVAAEAAVALASVAAIDFAELEFDLRSQPAALATWYLEAIRRLQQQGAVEPRQYNAISGERGIYGALLAGQ